MWLSVINILCTLTQHPWPPPFQRWPEKKPLLLTDLPLACHSSITFFWVFSIKMALCLLQANEKQKKKKEKAQKLFVPHQWLFSFSTSAAVPSVLIWMTNGVFAKLKVSPRLDLCGASLWTNLRNRVVQVRVSLIISSLLLLSFSPLRQCHWLPLSNHTFFFFWVK